MRILVVDADHISRRALCLLLENDGHEVVGVENLREAEEACVRASFDVLVCGGTRFGDGTAFELMRAVAERCQVCGILLDGEGADANRGLAERAGFARHFRKPVTYDQLHEAIASAT